MGMNKEFKFDAERISKVLGNDWVRDDATRWILKDDTSDGLRKLLVMYFNKPFNADDVEEPRAEIDEVGAIPEVYIVGGIGRNDDTPNIIWFSEWSQTLHLLSFDDETIKTAAEFSRAIMDRYRRFYLPEHIWKYPRKSERIESDLNTVLSMNWRQQGITCIKGKDIILEIRPRYKYSHISPFE